MQFSWYRAVSLYARPDEPAFLTDANLSVGGVYSVDGPDGIGDQYFEGLAVTGVTEATWLVASKFPADVDRFLELPVACVRIVESSVVWATVRVESITPVGRWIAEARLGDADTIDSVHPDVRAERPLRKTMRSSSDSGPQLWVNERGPLHPLRTPNSLKAVLSVPGADGRRVLIVPFSAEICYLIRSPLTTEL
jgi:hypothetical protein